MYLWNILCAGLFWRERFLCKTDVTDIPTGAWGRFKNTYELLKLRALKFSLVNKIHIFPCMGKIFCVEFQRIPLKFHTKYLTHTLEDVIFIQHWNSKSSKNYELIRVLETPPDDAYTLLQNWLIFTSQIIFSIFFLVFLFSIHVYFTIFIVSCNGLSSARCDAITSTKADISSISPQEHISIKFRQKWHRKYIQICGLAKYGPFCLD